MALDYSEFDRIAIVSQDSEDKFHILARDDDPSDGSGTVAPLGSLCLTPEGVYWKADTDDTDWEELSDG